MTFNPFCSIDIDIPLIRPWHVATSMCTWTFQSAATPNLKTTHNHKVSVESMAQQIEQISNESKG